MELDEFKRYWQDGKGPEFEFRAQTAEKLNEIIMKTISTVNELQAKNLYWKKMGDVSCGILLGVLAVNILLHIILPARFNPPGYNLIEIAFLALYAVITIRVFRYQAAIFDFDTTHALKDTLAKATLRFRRFYVRMNLIYLFLFPVTFFIILKMILGPLDLGKDNLMFLSAGVTALTFLFNHLYYREKYFKKISALETNLKELANESEE
ncbi:MAG: hypothetical protein H7Y13_13660 [Sphingobacteriaceae bacterium]|nr:hypothetical protein [Sphingobacteriaceae bacterium]